MYKSYKRKKNNNSEIHAHKREDSKSFFFLHITRENVEIGTFSSSLEAHLFRRTTVPSCGEPGNSACLFRAGMQNWSSIMFSTSPNI